MTTAFILFAAMPPPALVAVLPNSHSVSEENFT